MNVPIRILHVFAQMNRGGAETMIMNIYRNIDRSKIQFDFLVHTDSKCAYDDEITKLGGKIYNIPRYNGKNHFSYVNKWNDFLVNHCEHKIVHGHVRSTAAIYLKICNKFDRITISHSHSTSSGSGITSKIKNIMQYPIKHVADYYFACSLSAGEWLFGKEKIQSDKFFLINNSINVDLFKYRQQVRDELRNDLMLSESFVIGHVGRFDSMKNHDFLIDIFNEVNKNNSDSILILVGEGKLKGIIQKKVNSLGLSKKVIFTGAKSEVNELMQAIDVFVFPSLFEGLGIVAVEAQAAGLPTIVSETIPEEAYLTDLIEKEILSSTPEKWAKRILKHANNSVRYDMSKVIKSKGYDIEDTAKWIQSFYINAYDDIQNQEK